MSTQIKKHIVIYAGKRIPFDYYQLSNAIYILRLHIIGINTGVPLHYLRLVCDLKSKSAKKMLDEIELKINQLLISQAKQIDQHEKN